MVAGVALGTRAVRWVYGRASDRSGRKGLEDCVASRAAGTGKKLNIADFKGEGDRFISKRSRSLLPAGLGRSSLSAFGHEQSFAPKNVAIRSSSAFRRRRK